MRLRNKNLLIFGGGSGIDKAILSVLLKTAKVGTGQRPGRGYKPYGRVHSKKSTGIMALL